MSSKQQLLFNMASNWANMMVSAAIQVVLVPILLAALGKEGYGVWALLAYGLSYPLIFERAFALAINRLVAFYRRDASRLNRCVSASFLVLNLLAAGTLLVSFVFSFFIVDVFAAIPESLASEAQITCILVGVTLALHIAQSTFAGALRGYQYYTRCNLVMIGSNLLRAVLTVALVLGWKSIVSPQIAFAVSSFFGTVAMYWVAVKSIPDLSIQVKSVDRATLHELWHYTGHSIARSGSTIVMFNTLTLLVGWKGSASDVAVYDIAIKLPNFLRALLGGAQNVFLPVITTFHAEGQHARIKSVISRATRMCFVLTLPAVVLLFALSEELLYFWLRRDVSPELILTMRVLLISALPDALFGVWIPALVGIGRLRSLTIASVAGSVLVVLVSAVLIVLGLLSIPMVPAITMAVILWVYRGIWLPWYGLYTLKVGIAEHVKSSLLNPLVATAAAVLLLVVGQRLGFEYAPRMIRVLSYGTLTMLCFATISMREEVVRVQQWLCTRRQDCA